MSPSRNQICLAVTVHIGDLNVRSLHVTLADFLKHPSLIGIFRLEPHSVPFPLFGGMHDIQPSITVHVADARVMGQAAALARTQHVFGPAGGLVWFLGTGIPEYTRGW